MIEIRRSEERGHANHGWLDSYHSFSFANYYDPHHVGFGPLRVINEDYIAAGMGFGTHAHRDMEIITYMLDGALEHRDSIGNGSVIRPGDVQRMSAGCGVKHSEFNHLDDEEAHLLQIWIEPSVQGIEPSYEEKHFDAQDMQGRLRLIASPNPEDNAVLIHQDVYVYAGKFDNNDSIKLSLRPDRRVYVHVARGTIVVNGETLKAGDALKICDEKQIHLAQAQQAEVLLFDLP